jgi:hypothetical protein
MLIRRMTLDELIHRNLWSVLLRGLGNIDAETIAELGDTVRFPFSTTVCEEDIWDFLLLKDFEGSGSCRDSIWAEHENAIDVKCKRVIEFRLETLIPADRIVEGAGKSGDPNALEDK